MDGITFTPQVPVFRGVEPVKTYEESAPFKNEEKGSDNSGLLIGSLSVLGAFGLGMLARKPKVKETVIGEVIREAAPKVTPKEQEAAWKAAVKDNSYLQAAKKASKGTTTVTDDMIKASNPQMRPEEVSPELVKLRHDMQARAALADAESINKPSVITEEKIMQSNPQMRPPELKGEARDAREVDIVMAFNNHFNSIERAEKNTIGNLVSNKENKALEKVKAKAVKNEKLAKSAANGNYKNTAGKGDYTYVVENGKVTKIIDKQTVKGKTAVITDEKKIAKHMAKHNVSISSLKKLETPKKAVMNTKAEESRNAA